MGDLSPNNPKHPKPLEPSAKPTEELGSGSPKNPAPPFGLDAPNYLLFRVSGFRS